MKTKKDTVTVVITGGHITPALALVDALRAENPGWSIVCIGRRSTFEGDRTPSEEYRLMTGRGVPFLPITTGRFARYASVSSMLSLLKVPIGYVQSFLYLLRIRPSLVVSFGGYIALPVTLSAWIMGIPVVTHEQTRHASLSNRIIGWCARRIFVSYEDAVRDFPAKKTDYVGLPLRAALFHPPQEPSFPIPGDLPLLYITGGTTGAATLNTIVYQAIPELVQKYRIVHQTGRRAFDEARKVKSRIPADRRDRYAILPYLDESDVAWALHHAHIVIGRSGANTVGEIATLSKVAILVPLPWSAESEQQKNAQTLSRAGSSIVADQAHLTPDRLIRLVQQVEGDYRSFAVRAERFSRRIKKGAAEEIAKRIGTLVRAG
jgi:UDP-N-acetylglucosamine--N-acetylmuramyl-(pentapeptide) pyrophosphoryl-undecaprenol N-acetylglucosamine transferase